MMMKLISVIAGMAGLVVVCLGVFLKVRGMGAISVIGGADGPTSIFIAGRVGSGLSVDMIVVGIIMIAAGIFIYKWKRK